MSYITASAWTYSFSHLIADDYRDICKCSAFKNLISKSVWEFLYFLLETDSCGENSYIVYIYAEFAIWLNDEIQLKHISTYFSGNFWKQSKTKKKVMTYTISVI